MEEIKQKVSQQRIGTLWQPQEANASLHLCHFSPHRHPKCCSCEVMSVVMVTVCEPGIAHPPTSLFPPSLLLSFPPSLCCLPTRSFSPSPHMPGNQSLKQMWSDCRNESSSQQPYNCADEIAEMGGWGAACVEGLGERLNASLQKSSPFHCCEATAGRGLLIFVENNA